MPALIVLVLSVVLGLTLGAGPQATEQRSEAFESFTRALQVLALARPFDADRFPVKFLREEDASARLPASDPATIPVEPDETEPQDAAARGRNKASARKATASLDAMIGQMIMVGFDGVSMQDEAVRDVRDRFAKGLLGGAMLLGRNIESREQLRALTRSFLGAGAPLIPFISIDQEGGAVQRLDARRGFREIPTAREIARTRSPEQAGVVFGKLAEQLAESGVNLNFGPVVDLDLNPGNPVIGKLGRSFGAQPHRVAQYARWFIVAHRAHGVFTAPKHFPGHGSSVTDSHKGFTDISASWREVELEPFRELLRRNGDVDMIMVGHLFHPKFTDGGGVPASLSAHAIRYWLRDELGFRGVVVTDDLNMGAIEQKYSLADATIRAVNAGNDIVLFSNYPDYDPELAGKIHRIIKKAVVDGKILESRIAESYKRIRLMKTSE